MADDLEVRSALHAAVDGVRPAPDLLQRVRTGGKRRLARRRIGTGAVAVLVVAAFGGTLGYLDDATPQGTAAPPPVDGTPADLFHDSGGELLGDTKFLADAKVAFRRDVEQFMDDLDISDDVPPLPTSHPSYRPPPTESPSPWVNTSPVPKGEIHVFWAGRTPIGRTAVVVQRTEGKGGYMGFVYDSSKGLTTEISRAEDTYPKPGYGGYAAVIGDKRDVLVALDPGLAIGYSGDYRFGNDGRIVREYTRLDFSADDVAVVKVPSQRDRQTAVLKFEGEPPAGLMVPGLRLSSPTYPDPDWNLLGDGNCADGALDDGLRGGFQVEDLKGEPATVRNKPGLIDDFLTNTGPFMTRTVFCAKAPGGRDVRVEQVMGDGAPPRFVAAVRRAGGSLTRDDVVAAVLRPGEPFAAAFVRLPDGQGFLAVAPGATLRYRTDGGQWRDADPRIALLPKEARAFEATVPGKGKKVVELH